MQFNMPWNGLQHVHLVAGQENMEETIDFWTDIIGYDLYRKRGSGDRKIAFFTDRTYSEIRYFFVDEDAHELRPFVQNTRGEKERTEQDELPFSTGLHHVAWLVDDEEEVDLAAEQLQDEGVPTWGPYNRSNVSYSIYCVDPNGIYLQISTPMGQQIGRWEKKTEDVAPDADQEVKMEQKSSGLVRQSSEDSIARKLESTFWARSRI